MAERFEVLVVCVGNICRSPVAERLLRRRLATLLDGSATRIEVSSAGLRAMVRSRMDHKAAIELDRLGGDPHDFFSRQLTGALVDQADLVLTATQRLRSQVLHEAPRALKRTFSIRELAALMGSPRVQAADGLVALVDAAGLARAATGVRDYDVPDPIGGSPAVHRRVAEMLDAECEVIAQGLARAARGGVRDEVSAQGQQDVADRDSEP